VNKTAAALSILILLVRIGMQSLLIANRKQDSEQYCVAWNAYTQKFFIVAK